MVTQDTYLRWSTVQEICGLSRVTIWRRERDSRFPRRRQLSANSVGWLKSEVDAWVESRQLVHSQVYGPAGAAQ
jgi:prophage regulatory protein